MKKLALSLVLLGALAACSSAQPKPSPVQLDFGSTAPVRLDVQDIEIVNRAASLPTRLPYVGHMFKPSIAETVHQWADERLTTTGKQGRATLIIKDASVTSQSLPLASGMKNWFTRQQAYKYTANVEVDIEALSADNLKHAYATAKATRTATLPQDPTDAEKTQVYNSMLKELMDDFSKSMELAVQKHMSLFIVQ